MKPKLLLAGLSLVLATACPTHQRAAMTTLVLPRLDIPDRALLLYENIGLKDPDRTGNWRFVVRDDGCFFNARNTKLWLSQPEEFASDDPKLFWNTAFPDTPSRCLTPPQRAELDEAIREADLASLAKRSTTRLEGRKSSPSLERWTLARQGRAVHTVVVEAGDVPAPLSRLRATIDRLVAAAPRPNGDGMSGGSRAATPSR
jgi:hypothetical protein